MLHGSPKSFLSKMGPVSDFTVLKVPVSYTHHARVLFSFLSQGQDLLRLIGPAT